MLGKEELVQQRRHLTIMFTDLSASTLVASRMEPEEYSALLEKMRDVITSIVRTHGGSTIRIEGDGLIFIFGYPEHFEDMARRAVEAALDIHDAMGLINQNSDSDGFILQLHTGIHSGVVLLKPGDLTRGRYEILGDPTNVAAYLCDFAAPGEIIISDETLGRARKFFHTSQQQSLSIAGRKEKMLISKITKRQLPDKLQFNEHSTPFFGREKELNWLVSFIGSKGESNRVAIVYAGAGVGKSRLLQEFSSRVAKQGAVVHRGICEAYLGAKPLQPLEQIARSVIRSAFGSSIDDIVNSRINVPANVHSMAEILVKPKTDNTQTTLNNKQYGKAFTGLLHATTEETVIMILDDWQWVDQASKTIVKNLMNAGPENLKIILSTRTKDDVFVEMNRAKAVELQPFSSADIKGIVKCLLPSVEPFTLRRIQKYSGGNPLYLEELCHAVKDSRLGVKNMKSGAWLNSLIYTRFSQLPSNLAQIVKSGAVIGHMIPEWLLKDLFGEQLNTKTLEALRESDFLFPAETDGYIKFKHGITRDVIYQMVGLSERQSLHKKVIEKLRSRAQKNGEQEPHDQLAYHYAQSGDAEASLHQSQIAGDIALHASALDIAQAHFRNAMEQAEKCNSDEKTKLELLQKYGLACVVDPSWDQLPILEQAAEGAKISGRTDAIAWSEYCLGNNLYGLGIPDRSLLHFRKAYAAAQRLSDKRLSTQLLANMGQAYAAACQYDTAYEYLDQAIAIKTAMRSGKRASGGLAYALSSKGFALAEQGRYGESMKCFDEAEEALGEKKPQVKTSLLAQRACANLWNGKLDECYRLTLAGKALSYKVHSRYNYAQSVFMAIMVEFYRSGNANLIAKMIEATEWLLNDGIGQNLSLNYSCISDAFAQKGQWKKARIYAARALKRARQGDKICESQAYRALAMISKAGQCAYTPEYYIAKAHQSAKARNSVREIENNLYFENRFLGKAHALENEARAALYYV